MPHGGQRYGAGRPRTGRPVVSHLARPEVLPHVRVHVALRVRPGLASLLGDNPSRAIRDALKIAGDRFGFRVAHATIRPDLVHLVCEADDARSFTKGIWGLAIRTARAINRALERKGKLWAHRYHMRILTTPTEARTCLAYLRRQDQEAAKRSAPGSGVTSQLRSTVRSGTSGSRQ